VDAAWQVARDKGLAQVTLRDVAQLVGMRPPSLYTHFASKNAIYDAMFGDAWTQFLEYSRAAVGDEPAATRAAMRFYARVFFDFAIAFPARHQLMNLRTIPDFAPSPEPYAPSLAAMDDFVARMARRGVREQDDIDLFVAIVSGMVDAQLANDPSGKRLVKPPRAGHRHVRRQRRHSRREESAMTATALPRSDAAPRRPRIDRRLAMRLAADEYARCADLMARLEPRQWSAPTVNTDWTVRDTAGHMLGMVQMMSSLPQMLGQRSASMRLAKKVKAPFSIDHLTALQVQRNDGRAHPTVAAAGTEGGAWPPTHAEPPAQPHHAGSPARRRPAGALDVRVPRRRSAHTRLVDAQVRHLRCNGPGPGPTREHDGRLVDDIVREWADRHRQPHRLDLTGAAGGSWGADGERITIDALDFCRILSGRGSATGLLATSVPF
jgi:AcrR family transcriptional regulator